MDTWVANASDTEWQKSMVSPQDTVIGSTTKADSPALRKGQNVAPTPGEPQLQNAVRTMDFFLHAGNPLWILLPIDQRKKLLGLVATAGQMPEIDGLCGMDYVTSKAHFSQGLDLEGYRPVIDPKHEALGKALESWKFCYEFADPKLVKEVRAHILNPEFGIGACAALACALAQQEGVENITDSNTKGWRNFIKLLQVFLAEIEAAQEHEPAPNRSTIADLSEEDVAIINRAGPDLVPGSSSSIMNALPKMHFFYFHGKIVWHCTRLDQRKAVHVLW